MKPNRVPRLVLFLSLVFTACSNSGTTSPRGMTANSSGLALHARVTGDPASGNVLIAIHGGAGMTSDYMLSLEKLAGPDLAVVTYDQRGVGRSASPPADPCNYKLLKYAEDLDAVREAIGAERVHMFGYSWGDDDPCRQIASPAILAALPQADVETVVLSQCGHFWHECPEQFFRAMRAFLGLEGAKKVMR